MTDKSVVDDFFPTSERVIYKKSPLAQVICQLRFPTILKIEKEIPVDFQECIRDIFPIFEKNNLNIPPDLLQMLGGFASNTYVFSTEDRSSDIHLSQDSISLTVKSYTRWEKFRSLFERPLEKLVEIYNPNFFTRIGLRYVNSIDRNALGLGDHPWSQLLQKTVLGELSIPHFERNVEEAKRVLRIKGEEQNGSFLLQHGLANSPGHPLSTYVIDFDFYNDGKTECDHAKSTLNALNSRAGAAFRWCITTALHNAMEPEQLDRNNI